jgi:hypothetical protein
MMHGQAYELALAMKLSLKITAAGAGSQDFDVSKDPSKSN